MRLRYSISLLLVLGALSNCGDSDGYDPVTLGPDFECIDRPEDASGYLKPICEYLVANHDTYLIDPNDLQITSIEAGDAIQFPREEYDTAAHDYVYLDCCLSGDSAIMEVATKQVAEFFVGIH